MRFFHIFLSLFVVFYSFLHSYSFYSDDSLYKIERDCNADSIPDTLFFDTLTGRLLFIRWGQSDSLSLDQPAETIFIYPDWHNLRYSVSLLPFNTDDDYPDLLIKVVGMPDSSNSTESDIFVALFAGYGYQHQDTINLASITYLQEQPFLASTLVEGVQVVGIAERDPSGKSSARIKRFPLSFYSKRSAATKPVTVPSYSLGIFPNPARDIIKLEGNLPADVSGFMLTLYSANGLVLINQYYANSVQANISIALKVSDYASGTYFINVCDNRSGFTKTLPFILSK